MFKVDYTEKLKLSGYPAIGDPALVVGRILKLISEWLVVLDRMPKVRPGRILNMIFRYPVLHRIKFIFEINFLSYLFLFEALCLETSRRVCSSIILFVLGEVKP